MTARTRDDRLEARAHDILEAAPDGVMLIDASDHVRFVNSALCRLTGLAATELLGLTRAELSASVPWKQVGGDDSTAGTTERRVYEMSFRHPSGRRVWVQASMQRLITADGQPDDAIYFMIDVTRQHELEEALRLEAERLEAQVAERTARVQVLEARRQQSERLAALAQVAAGVAHEINNPLAGIKNALLLVRDAVSPDHPDRIYLEMVDKEVDRIGTIVKRLYEVYRPDAGQGRAITLESVLGDARQLVAESLAAHHVELIVDVDRTAPPLVVPPHQLLDIVVHLLRNAIEASPRGGVVTITATMSATTAAIAVADQGSGITDAVRPFIFDPFFTTKNVEQGLRGMGLGLSVSQSLASALGGRLSVETAVNRGSTFTLVIPRDQAKPEVAVR